MTEDKYERVVEKYAVLRKYLENAEPALRFTQSLTKPGFSFQKMIDVVDLNERLEGLLEEPGK